MKNLRSVVFFPVILGFFVAAGAAAAEISGYSIDIETKTVTSFSCDEQPDYPCFEDRVELGTLDISGYPWALEMATALAPTGELVVVDDGLYPEQELVWFELPTLERRSSLTLNGTFNGRILDIAFGPGSSLWAISYTALYEIDPVTGGATLVRQFDWWVNTMTWVGSKIYVAGDMSLYEFDPVTGAERLVADYTSPYGGFIVASICSFGGRLWSIGYWDAQWSGNYHYVLGDHDLQTGERFEKGFFHQAHSPFQGITLDLVNAPAQQAAAIPIVGRFGLAAIVILIGFAGVLLARRAS